MQLAYIRVTPPMGLHQEYSSETYWSTYEGRSLRIRRVISGDRVSTIKRASIINRLISLEKSRTQPHHKGLAPELGRGGPKFGPILDLPRLVRAAKTYSELYSHELYRSLQILDRLTDD
jgi:hypothetical protein